MVPTLKQVPCAFRIIITQLLNTSRSTVYESSLCERDSNDPIYANGIKTTAAIYQRNPDILKYPVAPHERGKTAEELFNMAIKPVTDFIIQNPIRNWEIVIKEFDKYSLSFFLQYNPVGMSLSTGAIESIKVLMGLEGLPELSFTAILREFLPLLDPNIVFYAIEGETTGFLMLLYPN